MSATLEATARVPLVDVLALLGLSGPSWAPWRVLAKCVDGLPLDDAERPLFERATGRTRRPRRPPDEIHVLVGRRGGKSRVAAAAAVRAAAFSEYSRRLAPGERASVPILAADRMQAQTLLKYAAAPFEPGQVRGATAEAQSLLDQLPAMVERRSQWQLDINTRASIVVQTASERTGGRSLSSPLAIADEACFWSNEDGSNPASAVFAALRPSLATLNGQLLAISSPYGPSGPMFAAFDRYHGREDADVLTWRAPSRTMNPTVPESIVTAALERDPQAAKAEWLAEWRDPQSALLSGAAIRRLVVPGRRELHPLPGGGFHVAFLDPSSGAGEDSQVLGIAHGEIQRGEGGEFRRRLVLDRLDTFVPPFNPLTSAATIAGICRGFGVSTIVGDAWGKGWVAGTLAQHGVQYVEAELSKSEIYREFMLLASAGEVELLDHPEMLAQIEGLKRRPGAHGHDVIDHAPGKHDDVANGAAGALVTAYRSLGSGGRLVW